MSIKVLDLFSGCGGLTQGLIQSNLDVVLSNEYWKPAHDTNKNNNQNTYHILGDITDDSVKQKIIKKCKKLKVNVITGGPPCQAYSNAGKKDQFDNRGLLYKDYIYIVKKIKPELCIIENVKGILSISHLKDNLNSQELKDVDDYKELLKNKEKSTDKRKEINLYKKRIAKLNELVIDKIMREFTELNYNITYKVLNSADFGVPQRRERVIFIAAKKCYNIVYPLPTHNKDGTDGLKKWVSVKTAIDNLKDVPDDAKINHVRSIHTEQMIQKMKDTEYEKSAQPKYKEAYFKCHPDKPSLTVKENHGAVFVHYEKNRCMTARELARLQSFPDDFIFSGSKKDVLVQIGNAIPCLLGKHLGENIRNIIENREYANIEFVE
jgi:DNA (cytosine-5)-methyltransferase 1